MSLKRCRKLMDGEESYTFRDLTITNALTTNELVVANTITTNELVVADGVTLQDGTPADTTDKLYNVGDVVYFNGAPLTAATASQKITLTPTWVAYGDSYTSPTGILASEIWAEQLAVLTGTTVIRKAVAGYESNQIAGSSLSDDAIVTPAYASYSSIVFIGINDAVQATELFSARYNGEWYQSYLAAILGLMLPQASIDPIRGTGWTEIGTWVNTAAYAYGRGSSGVPVIQQKIITGRFYAIRMTMVGGQVNPTFTIQMDGVLVNTQQNMVTITVTAGFRCTMNIIDMGTSAAREVTIEMSSTDAGDNMYLDWVAAWDLTTPLFRDVLLIRIPLTNGTKTVYTDEQGDRIDRYNENIKKVAEACQFYGGNVIYQDLNYSGLWQSDGIHTTAQAHAQYARDIQTQSIL